MYMFMITLITFGRIPLRTKLDCILLIIHFVYVVLKRIFQPKDVSGYTKHALNFMVEKIIYTITYNFETDPVKYYNIFHHFSVYKYIYIYIGRNFSKK